MTNCLTSNRCWLDASPVSELVNFGELVLGIWKKNLFCNGVLYGQAQKVHTKQIFLGETPHFEVHQGSPSSPTANFSGYFNNLVNLVYFSELRCVYGNLFALWFLAVGLVNFGLGIEVHQCTRGSLTWSKRVGIEAKNGPEWQRWNMCGDWFLPVAGAVLILALLALAKNWRRF